MSGSHGPQRGFSIVEMLVGIAIGLLVIGGATTAFAQHMRLSTRLALETRLQQELRIAQDIVAADLRRAGYRRDITGANPNDNIQLAGGAEAQELAYRYTDGGAPSDDAASNRAAFRLQRGVLQMKEASTGKWQEVIDSDKVLVTQFVVQPKISEIPVGHLCSPVCSAETQACPRLVVRTYDVRIAAQARADTSLTHETRQVVRIRNDQLSSIACP